MSNTGTYLDTTGLTLSTGSYFRDTGQLTINTDDNMYFNASISFVFGLGSGGSGGGCIYALGAVPPSGMGYYDSPRVYAVPVYNSSFSDKCRAFTLKGEALDLNGNMKNGT
jgi:hypothetical protein